MVTVSIPSSWGAGREVSGKRCHHILSIQWWSNRAALGFMLGILNFCAVPVQCVGVLSKALGNAWKGPAASLIEPMILTGLSSTLVQSLQVEILQLLYLLSHAHAQC